MNKITLLVITLCITADIASAQDIIYFYDGGKIEGKVLSVDEKEVTFKRKDNPDGPEYIEKKNKIVMVAYANGTTEVFAAGKGGGYDPVAENFKRNYIAWTITDMVALSFTISYEHILKSGKIGFRVPLTGSLQKISGDNDFLRDPVDFMNSGRSFKTGLDINYYPTGQGKAKYFVGPSFQFMSYKFYEYTYGNGPNYYSTKNIYLGYHYALLINNGMLIQPTRNFNFSFFFGVGVGRNTNNGRYNSNDYFGRVSTGFMIGFKL